MEENTEITEKKLENQFKKGFDPKRNLEGRPKGSRSFTTKVKEALEKIADGKEYTYEEAFIKAILKKAIVDQDTGMMKTVWEQLDGKPLQRTELTGKDGSDLIPKPLLGGQSNGNNNPSNSETTETQ